MKPLHADGQQFQKQSPTPKDKSNKAVPEELILDNNSTRMTREQQPPSL
jgi:hypothetical protein